MTEIRLEHRITEPAVGDSELEQPDPVRFWWLKRLAVCGCLILLSLVVLRLIWGSVANLRLERTMESFRESSQLSSLHEIYAKLDLMAAEDNAAFLLEQAISQLVFVSSSGLSIGEFEFDTEILLQERESEAEELHRANEHTLNLIRRARFKSKVAWSARLPGIPPGASQRNIARLLWFVGTRQRFEGDHQGMIQTVHDGMSFCESVAAHPSVLSSLTAWACDGLVLSLVEELNSDLSIEFALPGQTNFRPAKRADVIRLIDALLDEEAFNRSFQNAYHAEGFQYFEFVENLDELGVSVAYGVSQLQDFPFRIFSQPCHVLDAARIVHMHECAAKATLEPDWPRAKARIPDMVKSYSLLRSFSRPLSFDSFGMKRNPYTACVSQMYRAYAKRRMAAIALAIYLYRLDHGVWPKTLGMLVSTYLEELPRDPFDPDGDAIRSQLQPTSLLLYSVGEYGIDSLESELKPIQIDPDFPVGDIVFTLRGRKP